MVSAPGPVRVHRAGRPRARPHAVAAPGRLRRGGLADFGRAGVGDVLARRCRRAAGRPPQREVTASSTRRASSSYCAPTRRHHDAEAGEVSTSVHGARSSWARGRPGRRAADSPTRCTRPAGGLRSAADAAALPALSRIIGTTLAHVRTRSAQLPDDRAEAPSRPLLDVARPAGTATHRPPAGDRGVAHPDRTVSAASGLRRPGLRAWSHLRRVLGRPATAYESVGYWIEDAERERGLRP